MEQQHTPENLKEQKHIAIVEDDDGINAFLEDTLSHAGYLPHVLNKPLMVYGQIKTLRPDLIIMDIRMPFLNGLEQVQLLGLAEETKDIPIVIISANLDLYKQLGEEHRGSVHTLIQKPFDLETLLKAIEDIFNTPDWKQKSTDRPYTY